VTTAPTTAAPLLEARGLTKHFVARVTGPRPRRGRLARGRRAAGVVHAVEDVSIALAPGRVTAVVGESGSGKSTLARLLARLITPTSGNLLLDGHDVPASGRGRREYSGQVQMVLQDPFSSLNPVHDVRYHLARPLQVHGLGGSRAGLDGVIAGLLERVALTPPDQYLRKYPHELSGGQRQRVAIARALAVQPRILLADEPVSMLDVSIRLGLLNLLGELRDTDGLGILYITHDIASARYLADEIMVMYAGQVVESGSARVVTDEPAHPYTQLLLSAAPDPDRSGPPVLQGRGAPPSLVAPPAGCRFHPRCPHAMAVCADQVPPRFEVSSSDHGASDHGADDHGADDEGADDHGADHLSACWLHSQDLDADASRPLGAPAAVNANPERDLGEET
jgi:peptide/nickel transport system ATP-binding protein